MNYANMTESQLNELKYSFVCRGNMNAAREVSEFLEFYNKRIKVVKGRKVPKGTEGVVFWLQRVDPSKYGDLWGIYSYTRIGFKDDAGNTHFTNLDNVVLA